MAKGKIVTISTWYLKGDNEGFIGYVKRCIRDARNMYPKAREFGFRYYWDPAFRHRMRSRYHSRRARQLYGSGYLVNKQNYKSRIMLRDGCRCNKCKIHYALKKLTIDHVYPVFKGGKSVMGNLQLLCEPCHILKTREEFMQYHKIVPRATDTAFAIAFEKLYEQQKKGELVGK